MNRPKEIKESPDSGAGEEDQDLPDQLVPPPRVKLVFQDGRVELVDLVLLDNPDKTGSASKVKRVSLDQ